MTWIGNPFLEQFQNKNSIFKEEDNYYNDNQYISWNDYLKEINQNYINYHYCLIEPFDFEEPLPEDPPENLEEEVEEEDEEIDEDWLEYEMYLADEKFRY
jgi:hypothetical protein